MPHPESGFAVLFTGLPAAGKSTIARVVGGTLAARPGRPVSLLDGDALRREVSSDLGYSYADREEHMRRIGGHAANLVRAGSIALCSVIAPYHSGRTTARQLIEPHGAFVLIHVSTPLEICAARDPKGLYASARAGTLPHFTGVSDPYEIPDDAELTIDMSAMAPDDAGRRVVDYLGRRGLV